MKVMNRREFLEVGGAALAAVAAGGQALAAGTNVRGTVASTTGPGADDALGLAERVRRKEVTPLELVEAAISRIEKVNPKVNAVVTTFFDRARERAKQPLPDGPFRGAPFLLKDLIGYRGEKHTFGSVFFRDHVARETDVLVRRMEMAGLVMLGKTNTCEFGLLPTTEPVLHGPTRNPWSLGHSPGGSSGGAAAAVAAGMVPMAHASDGGGSIRVPASCCGLFGMKLSRGRNPEAPASHWHGLGVEHCVSRSVRDSAALADATSGPVPGDRWWAPRPARPFLEEVGADPGKLRIAFTATSFTGAKAHPDCVAAVQRAAALCETLGHHVEEAAPRIEGEAFGDAFLLLWSSAAGGVIKAATRMIGKTPPREAFEPFTWDLAAHEAKHTPSDVSRAFHVIDATSYAMAEFHDRYDVLLTPTLQRPPMRLGELDQSVGFEKMRARLIDYVAFTPYFNATGAPAMSVPLHWNEAGLPIGCHFVGRHADEATLFRLAGQLETAQPWAGRHPGVFAS